MGCRDVGEGGKEFLQGHEGLGEGLDWQDEELKQDVFFLVLVLKVGEGKVSLFKGDKVPQNFQDLQINIEYYGLLTWIRNELVLNSLLDCRFNNISRLLILRDASSQPVLC